MSRFLPFLFLLAIFSLFGISWIIWDIDPDGASVPMFALLITLIFVAITGFLGLTIYFIRSRFNRRISPASYIFSCFKISFFVALVVALLATLAILKLASAFNLFLALGATALLALYVYLGKKKA